jgi:hypothetical protein
MSVASPFATFLAAFHHTVSHVLANFISYFITFKGEPVTISLLIMP